jgi:hypothetical protein
MQLKLTGTAHACIRTVRNEHAAHSVNGFAPDTTSHKHEAELPLLAHAGTRHSLFIQQRSLMCIWQVADGSLSLVESLITRNPCSFHEIVNRGVLQLKTPIRACTNLKQMRVCKLGVQILILPRRENNAHRRGWSSIASCLKTALPQSAFN